MIELRPIRLTGAEDESTSLAHIVDVMPNHCTWLGVVDVRCGDVTFTRTVSESQKADCLDAIKQVCKVRIINALTPRPETDDDEE